MGFVVEFPTASPLESERFAEGSELAVECVVAVVGLAVFGKYGDIEGQRVVVHGGPTGGVTDPRATGGAAFGVEGVLLGPCAEAANAFDVEVERGGELFGREDKGGGAGVEIRVEGREVALAAFVEVHFFKPWMSGSS